MKMEKGPMSGGKQNINVSEVQALISAEEAEKAKALKAMSPEVSKSNVGLEIKLPPEVVEKHEPSTDAVKPQEASLDVAKIVPGLRVLSNIVADMRSFAGESKSKAVKLQERTPGMSINDIKKREDEALGAMKLAKEYGDGAVELAAALTAYQGSNTPKNLLALRPSVDHFLTHLQAENQELKESNGDQDAIQINDRKISKLSVLSQLMGTLESN